MKTLIHKRRLTGVTSTLPQRAVRVLHVAAQDPGDDLPTIWYEVGVDTYGDASDSLGHTLYVTPTGGEPPSLSEYLGSAVCAGGALVWHVYGPRSLAVRL